MEWMLTLRNSIAHRFWETIVKLLESESEVVVRIVKLGYRYKDQIPKRSFLFQMLFWSCIGLTLGLGIGIMIF